MSFLFQSNLSLILDIPKNGYFRIMIRYSLQISAEAEVNIVLIDHQDGDVINSTTKTFLECPTTCYHRMSNEFLYLDEGKIIVLIHSAQSDLKLVGNAWWSKLVTEFNSFHSFEYFVCLFLSQDKVIAIPKEFYVDTVIGDIASSLFQFKCNIDDNDMRWV